MTLPLEIRRKIYRHYIDDLPPLMYSSPQIYQEVADVTNHALTFQFFNGACPSYSLERDLANVAAVQLTSLRDEFQRKNLRFRIELRCLSNSSLVELCLDELVEVIKTRKMAPAEVYMTKGEVCSPCVQYARSDPVERVQILVERAERWRAMGAASHGVQTRCDCKGPETAVASLPSC